MKTAPGRLGASFLRQRLGALALVCTFCSPFVHQAEPARPELAAWSGLAKLPLCFEANCSPTASEVQFVARSHDGFLQIGPTEARITLRTVDSASSPARARRHELTHSRNDQTRTLRLQFLGADTRCQINGVEEFQGRVNYLIGSDVAQWRENAPSFSRVQVADIYPGVTLAYYGNQQRLEYDLVVAPGADPGVIAFRVTGADQVQVSAQGDLVVQVGAEQVRLLAPTIYQVEGNRRKLITGGYRLRDKETVAFQIGPYNRQLPLVIDPILSYSSYLFGNLAYSTGRAVALDSSGNIYVAGDTFWAGLATSSAYQTAYQGGYPGAGGDAFVAKLDPTGSNLLYLTYLGGNGDDAATSLAVDPEGNTYVTGVTDSTNFPIASATVSNRISGKGEFYFGLHRYDAFVAKLNPDGSQLMYSTYLGGSEEEVASGIAVDSAGCAYVTGFTGSKNFPVVNSLQGASAGSSDAFVTKIASNGMSFVYSTYLGGTNVDQGQAIAVDGLGRAYVAGYTRSTNFPVSANAVQTNRPMVGSVAQVFVSLLESNGASLVQSTYFGGTGDARAHAIALDTAGNAYVTGDAYGAGFPTTPGNLNPGGVFKSVDGAMNWVPSNSNLLHPQIRAIAIDPVNPANLYLGTGRGIARSTDSGATWQTAFDVFAEFVTLAVDPVNTATIYAGTTNVFKSVDSGVSWFACSTGLVANVTTSGLTGVNKLAVDARSNATVYAATANGVFKSLNAATNWTQASSGLTDLRVRDLALDFSNPATLYAATGSGVFRSTNGGARWFAFSDGMTNILSGTRRTVTPSALAVDPTASSTLYVGTDEGIVFKRTAGDTNWSPIVAGLILSNGIYANSITVLAVDPNVQTTLYAGTRYGLFKSLDAGSNWSLVTNGLPPLAVAALAIDPLSSSTLYLGIDNVFGGYDAFLAKFSSSLDSVIYSVTFGGSDWDGGTGVALDAAGDAFVVGSTTSEDFPTFEPVGYPYSLNSGSRDVFVTAINADASAFLYSTYLGGEEADYGGGIALDSAANAWVVGQTFSMDFPIVAASQSPHRGDNGGFLSKLQTAYSLVNVTVQSDPPAVPIVVDGVTYSNTPAAFSWPSGSFHTVAAPPQLADSGVRSAWISWSDGGDQTHRIFPTSDAALTANFKTQYLLSMFVTNLTIVETNLQANATNSGSISPPSGWYDAGTNVVITATPPHDDTFGGWAGSGSGSYSGTNNPATVAMDGPVTEIATFTGALTNRLKVVINGSGTVSPNYNGQSLQVGRTYTMTAKPASGYVFSSWIRSRTAGAFISSVPKLQFVMTNGLVWEANFVPSPFGPAQGTYAGLFYDTNVAQPESCGFFRATVKSSGSFSSKFQLGGRTYSVASQFSASGDVWFEGIIDGSLHLDLNGGNVITGQISSNLVWMAELVANRAVYSSASPAPEAASKYTLVIPGYTLLIPGAEGSPAVPDGSGFGTVAVDNSGNVTFSGTLGDGTKISQRTFVSGQGQWPFFASLYSGNGLILGWLTFTNAADSDINGAVAWFKEPVPRAKAYPGGFRIFTDGVGSVFSFTHGTPLLDFGLGEGQVILEHGGLAESITNRISIDAANKVTNLSSNKLNLTLKSSSGLFQGSVVDPATGKAITIRGALLQKQNRGDGYFPNAGQYGPVILGP